MTDHLPPPPPGGQTPGWSPVGPHATSSMPMPPMRSLKGLSVALLVLFVLIALVDIVGAGALFNRAGLLDDFLDGASPTFQEVSDADDAVAGTLGFHILLVVAIAAVFITWQWRHAKNAEVLGARGGLGPGWAIGGWFVPVANFVLPGVQLFQSSKASDVAARQQGRPAKGSGLVIGWAVVYAAAALLFIVGGGLRPADDEGNLQVDTPDDVRSAADGDRTAGAAMVVYVAAAALGAVMVRSLTAKQTAAYAAVAASPPPSGGPPPPGTVMPPAPTQQWGQPPAPPAPPPPPGAIPPPPGAIPPPPPPQ